MYANPPQTFWSLVVDAYLGGLVFVGMAAGLVTWVYAIATYGLLGLAVGWLAGIFVGIGLGAVWPLVALLLIGAFL